MFTGIVTAVGRILDAQPHDQGLRLSVDASGLPGEALVLGESIAVSGVCLTVAETADGAFVADVSGETLRLTTLGHCNVGDCVNLERALRASDRLGGHWVSGHVDGIGRVCSVADDALSRLVRFDVPATLMRFIAVKGSIAVDGVSLTVNAVGASGFVVNLIPHTLAQTTLGQLAEGAPVNLEIDPVARYVERLLEFRDTNA